MGPRSARSGRRRTGRGPTGVWMGLAAVAAALLLLAGLQALGAGRRPAALEEALRHAEQGRDGEAERLLAALEREWAMGRNRRLARVEAARREARAFARAFAEVDALVERLLGTVALVEVENTLRAMAAREEGGRHRRAAARARLASVAGALAARRAQGAPGEGPAHGPQDQVARPPGPLAEADPLPPAPRPPPQAEERPHRPPPHRPPPPLPPLPRPRLPEASLPGPSGPGGAWQDLLEEALTLEQEGLLAQAAVRYREAAEHLGGRDPALSADLRGLAEDALHVERLLSRLAAAAAEDPGRFPSTRVPPPEEGPLGWLRLPLETLSSSAALARAGPGEWLGFAVLAYRSGQRERGDRALVRALEEDPALQAAVDSLVARERGVAVPDGGFVRHEGRWVGRRERELALLGLEAERRLGEALRARPRDARDQAWRGLLEWAPSTEEPEGRAVLAGALARRMAREVEVLERSVLLVRAVERLVEVRHDLEGLRSHALELIFDEDRYFYPFRVPDVPSSRAREYPRVQAEVDRRVAAVRAAWEDASALVRLPNHARDALEHLHWLEGRFAALGLQPPDPEAKVPWHLLLPAEPGLVTLADVALDREERVRLEKGRRVLAYNRALLGDFLPPEREQVAITNAYRRMMGRMPLAVDTRLLAAARGHCEEMSRLGYFSHFSPVPERRTPYDRMRLAGYDQGVSENIAVGVSPQGAHEGWVRSSGHHRNLLLATHREFASGSHGSHFCQLFGRGTGYLDHPLFEDIFWRR